MKKFLVLALVCGIASLASAGLAISGSGTGVEISDVLTEYNVLLMASSPALDGAVPVLTPAGTDNLSYVSAYGAFDTTSFGVAGINDVYEINVAGTTGAVVSGAVHATADYGVQLGLVDAGLGQINLLDSNTLAILGTAYVVPEPATMALLGLGALVLRRKK